MEIITRRLTVRRPSPFDISIRSHRPETVTDQANPSLADNSQVKEGVFYPRISKPQVDA